MYNFKPFMGMILTAILAGSVFCANTLSAGGHDGILRSQSADALGQGVFHLGAALEYGREWDYIHSVDAIRDSSPGLWSGAGYLGFGLTPMLDIGLNLPMYYDRPNFGTSNAQGFGDLELSAKLSDYWLHGEDRVLTAAYYLAVQFPTGHTREGFFPRHAYYGSEGNWSSGKTLWHPMLISTIHFDRLPSPAPLRLNLNLGGVFNAPADNDAVTASMGLEVFPDNWCAPFIEISLEERFVTIHKDQPFSDLLKDPIFLAPGLKFTSKKTGLYCILAGDIGLSESDPVYGQINRTETGHTVSHQANPLYNLYVAIGWQKPRVIDADDDGIVDTLDKCPNEAGIAVNDGCPDRDADRDGQIDRLDQCPRDAEDRDGFMDQDGCPDRDNDEDGILDANDQCPDSLGIAANNGCPDTDKDGDGVPDRLDQCSTQLEDADSFQDMDGCPDYDNDGDGIPDSVDQCPKNPGVAETQGCPKTKEIARGALILKGVNFESGKAILLKGSYKVLDEIAESLREWPEVRVEIQGHTDNSGNLSKNLELSQLRAETVRQYLIDKGVTSDRLTAVGYGPDRPIADNNTATGRAQNRRVELNRLD